MVEPKARERAEEKEATTTTYERDIAGGSITDDVRTLPVRGLAVTERPQRGRKNLTGESHLSTRVRVRQRIRRWDGYLYNIDLFPYVEHRLLAFIEG